MIDLQSFNESLKIKWIKGYLDDNNKGKWKSFVNHYLEKHGGKLVFSANLRANAQKNRANRGHSSKPNLPSF